MDSQEIQQMYLSRFVRPQSSSNIEENLDREGKEIDGLAARTFYERLVQVDDSEERNRTQEAKNLNKRPKRQTFAAKTEKKKQSEELNNFRKDLQQGNQQSYINGLRLRQNNQKIFRKKNTLFKMINDGNIDEVRKILSLENEWINIRDDYGWTPMMSAVASGNVCMVEYLLDLKADVYSIRDKVGQSAWDIAVKLDKADIIELLFDRRVKQEPQNQDFKNGREEENHQDDELKYCKDCKINLDFNQTKNHFTSTAHLFNVYKESEDQTRYHLAANNIGYRMLKNAGWSEEKGLGPDGSGQKLPISTVLKTDRSGLGATEKLRKKVTHFKANDVAAIKSRRMSQRSQKSILKREKKKSKMKSKQWEINLRSYMKSD